MQELFLTPTIAGKNLEAKSLPLGLLLRVCQCSSSLQENGVDFRDIFGDGVRDRVDGRVAAYDEVPEH